MVGGQSVGRHYTGPSWDLVDGGGVKGKVMASGPGATANDIPWLEIEVVEHLNEGVLSDATSVQRVNTRGGMLHVIGHDWRNVRFGGRRRSAPLSKLTARGRVIAAAGFDLAAFAIHVAWSRPVGHGVVGLVRPLGMVSSIP